MSVLVGYKTGEKLTTGGSNTFLGYFAGTHANTTTVSRSIFIGWYSANPGGLITSNGGAAPDAGTSNNIIIGNNVGLPSASKSNKVVIGNNKSDDYYKFNGTGWLVHSDQRDKTDTGSLGFGLDLIKQLNPKYYKWNKRDNYESPSSSYSDSFTSSKYELGLIIQDIVALTSSYSLLSNLIDTYPGSYGDGTPYEQFMYNGESFIYPIIQSIKDLDGITAKTGSNSFTGTQTISGSLRISGSTSTGLFVNGLTTTTDNINRLTYNTTSGRVHYEVNKYKALFGDASNSSYAITHSLNSADIQVNIRDNSSGQIYYPSISAGSPPQYTATVTDVNTVAIAFTSAPSVNQYTIVVSK